jgi:hypothetical protein
MELILMETILRLRLELARANRMRNPPLQTYKRTAPNSTQKDNFSTKGNLKSLHGQEGRQDREEIRLIYKFQRTDSGEFR